MARKLHLNVADRKSSSSWNPEQVLAEALAEKARFLEDHPEFRTYQAEIDAMLEKAGSPENRMAVLAVLMEGKLIELGQQFRQLNSILLQVAGK